MIMQITISYQLYFCQTSNMKLNFRNYIVATFINGMDIDSVSSDGEDNTKNIYPSE